MMLSEPLPPSAAGRRRPLVSILMPVFNAASFLSEAIASVLHQNTDTPWELLLADDGSSDGSLEIGRSYALHFPDCIHLLRHPFGANRGTSATRNLALAHARGEVISFLDADDVFLPDMLDSQLRLLARFPEAALVYANAERSWDMRIPYSHQHGCQGDNTLPPVLPAHVPPGLLPREQPLHWFLEDESLTPCTCTVLVRTDIARAVGGFAESIDGLYDDQAFYAKIMLEHRVAASTRCVARYRRHAASCCGKTWHNEAAQHKARERFLEWLQAYRGHLLAPQPEFLLTAAD